MDQNQNFNNQNINYEYNAQGNNQNMNYGYNTQGYGQNVNQGYDPNMAQSNYGVPIQSSKSKVAAGLFGIFFPGLGVHKFYLGYAAEGGIMLGIWLACFVLIFPTIGLSSIGCITINVIGWIEGFTYLAKSDEEFYRTYVLNKKGWF